MNRNNRRYSVFLVLMILSGICLSVQSQTTEYESRLGISFKTNVSERLSAGLNLEQRFGPDFISFDRILAEPEIAYQLGKSIDISLSYRIAFDKDEANYFLKHRWSPAISYTKELGDWRLKYTATAQYGSPDYDEVHGFEHFVLRNKVSLRYTIFGSRFRPELRAELFSGQQSGRFLNHQVRIMALSSYRLTRLSALEFYLQYDYEYNIPRPERACAIGLTYTHQLLFR